MRFRILGPLQVSGGSATVTAGRDRVVLAMLLLHAGQVVPIGELVDAIWANDPPTTARGQLHTCVSRLRRILIGAGVAEDTIITESTGYRCRLAPEDLDRWVFDRLVILGRSAAAEQDWPTARDRYRAALALWRGGTALTGINSQAVRQAAGLLDEQRVSAVEECVEVELRLGLARILIAELTDLVAEYPLRERLRAQFMRALHEAGRPADALGAYQQARRVLGAELGVEPGHQLRELHQRILADAAPVRMSGGDRRVTSAGLAAGDRRVTSAGLAAGDRRVTSAGLAAGDRRLATGYGTNGSPVHHLPRTAGEFTGHEDTVARLTADRAVDGRPVLRLIDGMAGSGKTAVAVRVADLLTPEYPDAQLFLDLRGDSDRSPLEPAAALTTLLRQLGVPGQAIPAELDGRIRLWRAELEHRRTVLVLDSAAGTDQVTPLLPVSGTCLTLVTSRRRLLGLDGVRPESLRLLTTNEGVDLLARIAGDRVRAEPEAAAVVVRRCGHLPLAVRLAGARLAYRPDWRVTDLAARLRADRSVLIPTAAGHRSVQSAFSLSYAHLPGPAQRMFRLLGLFPGGRFDGRAAAALAGLPLDQARDLLDDLVDWHLLEEPTAGRYQFHELVREYAATLLAAVPGAERTAAVTGLLDYYLHGAVSTSAPLVAAELVPLDSAPALRPDLVVVPTGQAFEWLETERPNITAVVRLALAEHQDRYAWSLAWAAWFFYYQCGYLDDLIEAHTRGLAAAMRSGNAEAIAQMRNKLASGYFRGGRQRAAIAQLMPTLEHFQRTGNDIGVAQVRLNLGVAYAYLGRADAALEHVRAGLALRRQRQDLNGMAHALSATSEVYLRTGRYADALLLGRWYLRLAREQALLSHHIVALTNVGLARARLGQYRPAYRLLSTAVVMNRRHAKRYGEGEAFLGLGLALTGLGRPVDALTAFRAALDALPGEPDPLRGIEISNGRAMATYRSGDPVTALRLFEELLANPAVARYPLERARTLDGVATCLVARDPATARANWRAALEIYRALDLPEARTVEGRLAGLTAAARRAASPDRPTAGQGVGSGPSTAGQGVGPGPSTATAAGPVGAP